MKIIENGQPIEGIPYPVAVWDAKHDFWDDSIVELSGVFANSEPERLRCTRTTAKPCAPLKTHGKPFLSMIKTITAETLPAPSASMLYLFHTPTSSEKVKTHILKNHIPNMRNTRNGTCSNMRNGTRAKKTN